MNILGTSISDDKVIEVGESLIGFAVPVRLGRGSYAILHISSGSLKIWQPDNKEAEKAIQQSLEMPAVRHGIGSDVIHVRGNDSKGRYLVKLFYNAKKIDYNRQDEIYRY